MIVSVSGPPGSGKTSVIEQLSGQLGGSMWREDVASFPFLATLDQAEPEQVFLNQADFLIRKLGDAATMSKLGNAAGPHLVEVDWLTCHIQWSRLLARSGRISGRHSECLESIYRAGIAAELPVPDRAYYLAAPFEVLWERMNDRGREFEADYAGLIRDLAEFDPALLGQELPCPFRVVDASEPLVGVADRIAVDLAETGLGTSRVV